MAATVAGHATTGVATAPPALLTRTGVAAGSGETSSGVATSTRTDDAPSGVTRLHDDAGDEGTGDGGVARRQVGELGLDGEAPAPVRPSCAASDAAGADRSASGRRVAEDGSGAGIGTDAATTGCSERDGCVGDVGRCKQAASGTATVDKSAAAPLASSDCWTTSGGGVAFAGGAV